MHVPQREITAAHAGLVFLGGMGGTMLRTAVLLMGISEPLLVAIVNVVGAAALGGLTGYLDARASTARSRRVRLLVGTGFLGGFTTYSSLAMIGTHGWGLIGAAATVLAGVAAAVLGVRIGRRVAHT